MDKPWINTHNWLTPYKPPHRRAIAPPPTPKEREQIAYFREFRTRCREGPYFTEFRSNAKIGKPPDDQKAGTLSLDGFEGLKTYTNKYRRKARAAPRLDMRPYYRYLITVEGGRQCALAEVNQDLYTRIFAVLLTRVEGAGEWGLEGRGAAGHRNQWPWGNKWSEAAQV